MKKKILAVLIGGFIGGGLREAIEMALATPTFPWATLVINLTGAFMLSFLNYKINTRWAMPPAVATGLTTGIVGSYTTYSTLILENNQLIINHHIGLALLYLVVSFGGGLLATILGMRVGGKHV
ncbi:CrcB family protein [Periweissella fabaria]|uniref:Fluoride-specific ion channel FluC n=1 Tax=Periweissella fabaria TaxID=546157 RepID=A0ABM8Z5J3_9LACO|nr:CrcB family protein [Periweissella fabaria]MCM0596898.1 CrcB family protein [Periweissella fabaria]CAH0416636.1 Putative fluoride ion transporter CrcB [Periweissella fabaria]